MWSCSAMTPNYWIGRQFCGLSWISGDKSDFVSNLRVSGHRNSFVFSWLALSGQTPHMEHRLGPAATPQTKPQPRLLDQVRAAIRTKHYSPKTEEAYVAWTR